MSARKPPNKAETNKGGAAGPAPHLNGAAKPASSLSGIITADQADKTGGPEKAQSRDVRRVLIGAPSRGFPDAAYAFAREETIRIGRERGIEITTLLLVGRALIQLSRNELVKHALDQGYDDLLFIDDDQDWKPEDALQLLDYPVDVVGAAVRDKDMTERYNVTMANLFSVRAHPEGHPILTTPDLGIGTGFMRLSRRAMQALWDHSEPYGEQRMMFDVRVMNGVLRSEDFHACQTLREAGLEIWLDPAIVVGHWGRVRFAGDFSKWFSALQQQVIKNQRQGDPAQPEPA